jgi:hypothetical protein
MYKLNIKYRFFHCFPETKFCVEHGGEQTNKKKEKYLNHFHGVLIYELWGGEEVGEDEGGDGVLPRARVRQ